MRSGRRRDPAAASAAQSVSHAHAVVVQCRHVLCQVLIRRQLSLAGRGRRNSGLVTRRCRTPSSSRRWIAVTSWSARRAEASYCESAARRLCRDGWVWRRSAHASALSGTQAPTGPRRPWASRRLAAPRPSPASRRACPPGPTQPGTAPRPPEGETRRSCGDFVGISACAGAGCAIGCLLFPRFRWSEVRSQIGWSGAGSNRRPSAFQKVCHYF